MRIKAVLMALLAALSLSSVSAEQRLYWADKNPDAPKIYSSRPDGSDRTVLINFVTNPGVPPRRIPGALTFDDTTNRLYFFDERNTQIIQVTLPGLTEVPVADEPGGLRFLDIDPLLQELYWNTGASEIVKFSLLSGKRETPGEIQNTLAVSPQNNAAFFGSDASIIRRWTLNPFAPNPQGDFPTQGNAPVIDFLHKSNRVLWYDPFRDALTPKRFLARNLNSPPTEVLLGLDSDRVPHFLTADRDETAIFWMDIKRVYRSSLSAPGETLLFFDDTLEGGGITMSCGHFALNTDGDSLPDCEAAELCPNDGNKLNPGACGCGVPDIDSDNDQVFDCNDRCPADPNKFDPGTCGCGQSDAGGDSDGDGTANCFDACPADPLKTAAGACGCGVEETANCGVIRQLAPGLKITEPPQVIINNRNVTLIFEKFLKATLAKPAKGRSTLAARKGRVTSRYTVNLRNKSAKTKAVYNLSTKRTQLTLKNLKPGNYIVNYRAEILKDGNVAAKTNFSPKAGFTIQ